MNLGSLGGDAQEARQRQRQRRQKLLLLGGSVVVLLLAILLAATNTNAWTPPPLPHAIATLFPARFGQSDLKNSIDGRIAIGYWDETKRGGSVTEAVDRNWDPQERQMVMDYLQLAFSDDDDNDDNPDAPKVLMRWRGLAMCRECGEVLGNTCHGDKKYNWPDGYIHYIEKHNVKPPKKFIDHVRAQTSIIQARAGDGK